MASFIWTSHPTTFTNLPTSAHTTTGSLRLMDRRNLMKVQTTLTTFPIHYISSWSPSYEASQRLGLQLYELTKVRLNSISLSLSWLTEGIYRPLQFASIIAYHKEDQHVLWSTSNEHPVDLCMIIMLFLRCPYLHLRALESGSSRIFMPVEKSVVRRGDISRGIMGESSQSQSCMWQLLTVRKLPSKINNNPESHK